VTSVRRLEFDSTVRRSHGCPSQSSRRHPGRARIWSNPGEIAVRLIES